MNDVSSDRLSSYDFHIEFRYENMCSISLVRLYYTKLHNTNKLSIQFTRAKSNHKFTYDIVNKIEIIDELRHGFENYTNQIIESQR